LFPRRLPEVELLLPLLEVELPLRLLELVLRPLEFEPLPRLSPPPPRRPCEKPVGTTTIKMELANTNVRSLFTLEKVFI
jgi:hypothetical protein